MKPTTVPRHLSVKLQQLETMLREVRDYPAVDDSFGDNGRTKAVDIFNSRTQQQADEIRRLVDKLNSESDGTTIDAEIEVAQPYSLGIETRIARIRPIVRGFIEPLHCKPIVSNVPKNVVYLILKIDGMKDLLDREHHGHIGWHYHYLNSKKQRSDTVLCWDIRVPFPGNSDHPLFCESHAEGHAAFSARPKEWADRKRKSIHAACSPDLKNRKMEEFRCASNDASPVWPTDAVLTPISGTD